MWRVLGSALPRRKAPTLPAMAPPPPYERVKLFCGQSSVCSFPAVSLQSPLFGGHSDPKRRRSPSVAVFFLRHLFLPLPRCRPHCGHTSFPSLRRDHSSFLPSVSELTFMNETFFRSTSCSSRRSLFFSMCSGKELPLPIPLFPRKAPEARCV